MTAWSDPIVGEVHRVREAYAARFGYDLRAIFRDFKEREKRSGRKVVSLAQRRANLGVDGSIRRQRDSN